MRVEVADEAGFGNLSLIEAVVEACDLPEGRLLLLLSPKGAPSFDGGGPYLGLFYDRRYAKYAPAVDGIFWGKASSDYGLAVALFREALSYGPGHPAYLAFLLAHELEHARIAATEPGAVVLADLIRTSIRDASDGQISGHSETPEEVQCDKAGKHVALKLLGEEAFIGEMRQLAADAATPEQAERFCYLEELDPTAASTALMTRLRRFAAPYRKELEAVWLLRKDQESGTMLELVSDITALLDEPPDADAGR